MVKDDLNDVVVFAAVVEAGTFTGAASRLNMPKSTVSTRISRLEKRLNARLLERTTRHQSLTEAGRVYFDACRRILREVENAHKAVSGFVDQPGGVLRISLPFAFARSMLAPRLSDFSKKYPNLRIHLQVNNHHVDLVRENIDVALRVRRQLSDQEVPYEIVRIEQKMVASRDYIDSYGMPLEPSDLHSHRILAGANNCGIAEIWKENGDDAKIIRLEPFIAVAEPEARAVLIKHGHGVGWLPSFLCESELADGSLIQCLSNFPIPDAIVFAVTPSIRSNDHRVRIFIDFLRESFARFSI